MPHFDRDSNLQAGFTNLSSADFSQSESVVSQNQSEHLNPVKVRREPGQVRAPGFRQQFNTCNDALVCHQLTTTAVKST